MGIPWVGSLGPPIPWGSYWWVPWTPTPRDPMGILWVCSRDLPEIPWGSYGWAPWDPARDPMGVLWVSSLGPARDPMGILWASSLGPSGIPLGSYGWLEHPIAGLDTNRLSKLLLALDLSFTWSILGS